MLKAISQTAFIPANPSNTALAITCQRQPEASQPPVHLPSKALPSHKHYSSRLLSIQFAKGRYFQQTIPVVNISPLFNPATSPEQKTALANVIGEGMRAYGFIAITGHGIPKKLMNDYYEEQKKLFQQPETIKMQYARADLGYQAGYLPTGIEKKSLREGEPKNIIDKKEAWQSGGGQNVFPDKEQPNFRKYNQAVFKAMERVGLTIISALDTYLEANGQITGMFVNAHGQPDGGHLMRTIHYPPLEAADLAALEIEPGLYSRAGVHSDFNFITLLPQSVLEQAPAQIITDTANGLEIKYKREEWLPILNQQGAIIVNAGKALQLATAGMDKEIPATKHRVVGRAHQFHRDRYAFPFFMQPNFYRPLIHLKTGKPAISQGVILDEAGKFFYERLSGHGEIKGMDYSAWKTRTKDLYTR